MINKLLDYGLPILLGAIAILLAFLADSYFGVSRWLKSTPMAAAA